MLAALEKFDVEERNVRQGQKWATKNSTTNETAAMLARDYCLNGGDILGLRYCVLGSGMHEGIQWHSDALQSCRILQDDEGESHLRSNLGALYSGLDPLMAIKYLTQSLKSARKRNDRKGEVLDLSHLAIAYSDLGGNRKVMAERAFEYAESALKFAQELDDIGTIGHCLATLGFVCCAHGEVEAGIEYYRQQITIAEELGDLDSIALGSWNIAIQFFQLGRREEALELAEQAIEIYEEIDHPDVGYYRRQIRLARSDPNYNP